MIGGIITRLLSDKIGKQKWQTLFQYVHNLALQGMNIGQGSDTATSGELALTKYLQGKFSGSKDIVIFDVGANDGSYCEWLCRNFQSLQPRVFAFEPSAFIAQKLGARLKGFDFVNVVQQALSNEEGRVTLFRHPEFDGLSSLYNRDIDAFHSAVMTEEIVVATTLDQFCRTHDIDFIHFLKLDVEGHELKVLQGGANLLQGRSIQHIQFEFGGTHIDARTFFKDFYLLLSDHYQLYRIVQDGLVKIEVYSEDLEIFKATNYLAVLKDESGTAKA